MGRGAGPAVGTQRRAPQLEELVVAPQPTQQLALSGQKKDWSMLVPRLLEHGGEKVVIPTFTETDMEALLSDALQVFDGGDTVEVVEGKVRECHGNSALLYREGRGQIATGYALSDDGLWRQHSWVVAPDGHVIETTRVRERYCGVVFDEPAAARFAAMQLDGVS